MYFLYLIIGMLVSIPYRKGKLVNKSIRLKINSVSIPYRKGKQVRIVIYILN